VDSSSVFFEFCNQHYGTAFCKEDITVFEFNEHWGVSKREIQELWLKCREGILYQRVKLYPGAAEMLLWLSEYYNLHLITNQPPNEYVSAFLSQNLPNQFRELHFCSRPDTMSVYRSKSSVCKMIGANTLLEDHPKNVRECAEADIHVYMFEQPWNRGYEFPLLSDKVTRVAHW